MSKDSMAQTSADSNTSFGTKPSRIDCCGGNIWIWRKNLTPESLGLTLIKAAECKVRLPANWRDNIEVVSKKRSKVAVPGGIESLAEARKIVSLDDEHRALLEALEDLSYTSVWLQDHNLLQTHTKALEAVYLEQSPPIKGIFTTSSFGSDPSSPNCFMFPVEGGGWRVYRFSPGVSEANTWLQDDTSWTTCDYNMTPTLRAACLAFGGVEDDRNGTFAFTDQSAALKAMASLGQRHAFPVGFEDRVVSLGQSKDGRLTVAIKKEMDDATPEGYIDARSTWRQVCNVRIVTPNTEETSVCDDAVRRLISPSGASVGWMICSDSGRWDEATKDDCKSVLVSHGLAKKELDGILGQALRDPWKIVTRPFEPEFPGDRQWNKGAAQLSHEPSNLESCVHPCWDTILDHAGCGLDGALGDLEWAKASGITKGKDYLTAWIASLIKHPFEPLPYLFLFGPENSGKSILFEAISLLFTAGVIDADRCLKENNDFNGELENAVVCYIDEKDLATRKNARNKIKEWVTSRNLSIRRMRMDQYAVSNTTHWIHCANDQRYCPVFPGDTRITMMYVPPLPQGTEIPKSRLMERLKEEAPQFLQTLMELELPPEEGRLRIPVVETRDKCEAADAVEVPLLAFIKDNVVSAPGDQMLLADLNKRLPGWCAANGHFTLKRVTSRDLESAPTRFQTKASNRGRIVLDAVLAV